MAETSNKDGPQHDVDLTSILTSDERVNLTLLISNITELMRKQISDSFDASLSSVQTPPQALNIGDKNPNIDSHENKSHDDSVDEKKAHELQQRREKELSVPEMLVLEKDCLAFFDEWRDSVISRVGNVINNPKTLTDEQKKNASVEATPTPEVTSQPQVIDAKTNIEEADAALIKLYPPTSTSLYSLPRDKRILLLNSMLLLLLSLEHYNAQSRILLLYIASSLHLPLHILTEQEVKVAQGLLEAAKHMSGSQETQKRSEENQTARRWKVGLAGVAGAAVIGVTGGLAAPLVAGAIGTVMGGLGLGTTAAAGLLGTLAESGVIVGSLFGAYGGRMTGKMMDQYAKEVDDFAFLPLKGSIKHDTKPEDRRLRVTIGVSGWITQKEDIIIPWRAFGKESEIFALRWELKSLTSLGASLETVVKSAAWTVAKKEIIARTIFASLMTALWPIGLLKISKIVDNPFSVAKTRADKAGLVLADALINRAQGERPVTLIGYSLGARLIYSCLMSLAERRAFGLVESVALLGTPAPSDATVWRSLRSVVSGRLLNVYSENDYILAFLYRTSSIQYGVAGLQEIQGVKGVENVDVTDMVSGHLRYQYMVGCILEKVGWEDIDVAEVRREEETLKLLELEEEEEKKEHAGKDESPEEEAKRLELEVKEKTDPTVMEKVQGFMGFGGSKKENEKNHHHHDDTKA